MASAIKFGINDDHTVGIELINKTTNRVTGVHLSIEEARELARALLACADEAETKQQEARSAAAQQTK